MHVLPIAGVLLSTLSLAHAKPAPMPKPTPPPSLEEAAVLQERQSAPSTTCFTTNKSPPPPGYVCSGHGTLSAPAPITTTFPEGSQPQTDLCRDLCYGDDTCHGYGYRNTDGRCILYSKDFVNMGYRSFNNPVDFFNLNCFTTSCTTITPSSSPENTFTCTPGVPSYSTALATPTAIFRPDGAPHDDQSQLIKPAPFPISFYGKTGTQLHVSVNGFLSVGPNSTFDSDSFQNQMLPWYFTGSPSYIPNVWFGGYWDDLIIPADDPNNVGYGVYYEVTGTAPNRAMTFQWVANRVRQDMGLINFFIAFQENKPGRVVYIYKFLSDGGTNGTIGIQDYMGRKYLEYAYQNDGAAPAGTKITFDARRGKAAYVAERPCPGASG